MASLAGLSALAAPKSELWDFWEASDESSETSVSHEAWDSFLKKYVSERDGINLVAYGAVTEADAKALKEYVAALAGVEVRSLRRDEQAAFWINMYNAVTIDLILDHYPLETIRDISPGLFGGGPWDDEVVTVEGEALTLNDIEHRILRPIWRDARVHYAVNCASIGCPNLAVDAYTADNLERLLEAGARAYVNHPRGASAESGRLHVSSIYEWFKEDFGGTDAGVIEHLRGYAEGGLASALGEVDSIAGDAYDWSLNDRP